MNDYIKTKEYKFPDGETMTAYFDEYGIAKITIQALDAIFDNYINSADRVEVVRCKDCKYRYYDKERNLFYCQKYYGMGDVRDNNYCSFGENKN